MGKVAIVLDGGVDRGAYQAGSLRAIFEIIPPSNEFIIVGTSIGALNGAIIAGGISSNKPRAKAEELIRLWKNEISPASLFGKPKALLIGWLIVLVKIYRSRKIAYYLDIIFLAALNIMFLMSIANKALFPFWLRLIVTVGFIGELATAILVFAGMHSLFTKGYLLENKYIRKLLEKHVTRGGKKRTQLVITATSLQGELKTSALTYETQFIFKNLKSRNAIIEAAVTSSAMPVIFPSSKINKKIYVDGGVKNNTPLNYAIDQGADTIILITHQPKEKPLQKAPNGPFEKLAQIADILLFDSIENDLRRAKRINRWLESLERFKNKKSIKNALGLNRKRPISIIEIRPQHQLGGWFEALYNKKKIVDYIAKGYQDTYKKRKEIISAL